MKTKIIFLCIFLLSVSANIFSQENALFGMQGLSQNGNQVYEVSGNLITVVKNKGKLQEKDIKKMKKKYELNNVVSEYSDPALNRENLIITSVDAPDSKFPHLKNFKLCYLLPLNDKEMDVVLFQSLNHRDSLVDKAFMKLYFDNQLSQYTSDSWSANEIDFVGRRIEPEYTCRWMFPHSVLCRGLGQMSWSTFATEKEAQLNNEMYMMVKNAPSKYFKTLSSEDVNVIFEGEPIIAKRVVNKISDGMPKFMGGGSNILAIYYVVAKVRGHYVSCVLSQYIDKEDDYTLSPLLKEVMSLAENK